MAGVTEVKTFKTTDGTMFEDKAHAHAYEEIYQLVQREILYTDGKALVMNFIMENKEELQKIFNKTDFK